MPVCDLVLHIGLLKSVEVHQITLPPEDVHSLVLSGQIILVSKQVKYMYIWLDEFNSQFN